MFVESVKRCWEISLDSVLMSEVCRSLSVKELPHIRKFLAGAGIKIDSDVNSILGSLRRVGQDLKKTAYGALLNVLFYYVDGSDSHYREAVIELDNYLKATKKTCLIIVDTVEDYQLHSPARRSVVSGLLKCAGEYGDSRRQIRLCLPGENFFEIKKCSKNPLKDFSRNLLLQWTPREIFRIIAWRYKIYCFLYDRHSYAKLEYLDHNSMKGSVEIIDQFMPIKINNRKGIEERTIRYIFRHSQLMPRQIIVMLNSIFGRTAGSAHEWKSVDQTHVVDSISSGERTLVDEIFSAFEFKYPQAKAYCKAAITQLPQVFGFGELHRVYNRHCKAIDLDAGLPLEIQQFRKMLIEIGAVGRVRHSTNDMINAEFEYAQPGRLYVGTDDHLCLHPIFSGIYGRNAELRASTFIVVPQQHWFDEDNARSLKVIPELEDEDGVADGQ
ncbi:MAG: hypothetical protein EON58_11265 [Alphaproteobacteria bacterium]|nr:MAG: hypothetical protein EON58_11265 [Alphaproteobacteria bacterium]